MASNPVNPRRTVLFAAVCMVALCGGLGLVPLWRGIPFRLGPGPDTSWMQEVLAVVPHEKRGRGRLGRKDKLLLTSPMVSFFQESFFRLRTAVEQAAEPGTAPQCRVCRLPA